MELSPPMIREAKIEDLPEIVAIYNSTIESRMVTADLIPITPESRLSWFNAHNSRLPIYVSTFERKIIGWISLQKFYDRAAYDETAELSLYCHPEYRKSGVGTCLMEFLLKKCTELKIFNIIAFVFGHNLPCLSFLKKFEFEQWGFLPGVTKLDGIIRDIVILGKKIA